MMASRATACLVIAMLSAAALAKDVKDTKTVPAPAQTKESKRTQPPAATPLKEWTNASAAPLDVALDGEGVVFVELGRERRPYRVLPGRIVNGQATLAVPAGATVQAWSREGLAAQKTNLFAGSARLGSFPGIVVGTVVETTLIDGKTIVRTPAWQSAPGRFRAFPGGDVPVVVTVKNEGKAIWKSPRVRLFAPDSWTVSPAVADLSSPMLASPRLNAKSAISRGVAPGMSGSAVFRVRLPKGAAIGSTAPIFAFLRFQAAGQTVTVQNSVDVTVQEPLDRRYAMNEDGSKLFVRLINRFAPTPIGQASVEVRQPAGTDWQITQPAPVAVAADADAVAKIRLSPPTDDQIGLPVVVNLGECRMGYTPIVYGVARYGAGVDGYAREKGVRLLKGAGSPCATGADGLCCHLSSATQNTLAFDVADKFATSDPNQFLSPTWVTVTLSGGNASRVRLEYDAFNGDTPSVAGDLPIANPAGGGTYTFLLPDARFAGGLPGKADFRLEFTGDPCIAGITVSKWNPAKAVPAK